jgi:hypothetical protein
MTDSKQYKTMTLSECAKFDHMQGARNKLTGWGRICADRAARGVSRKARVMKNRAKGAK